MNDCPSPEELARFAVGDLDAAAFARLAAHVERCPRCETSLQALDGSPDPLVTALQQPSHAALVEVPAALLTAARSALHALPAGGTGEPLRRVGKFELRDQLGNGSFGTVFLAMDTE